MSIFWLTEEIVFPDPCEANEDGILAIGGDLSIERLLLAYKEGIFPWFNPEDPILWWCPNPRYVLFPRDLVVAKSMRPLFNQKKMQVTFDRQFVNVMKSCQTVSRKGQDGLTWITEEMIEAYTNLHHLGIAHSVEVWQDGELVGGLYGVSIGKCFFGESMFAKVSNASKFGFITLVSILKEKGFWLIDCQQGTKHLISLGARGIPRTVFLSYMKKNKKEKSLIGNWEILLAR